MMTFAHFTELLNSSKENAMKAQFAITTELVLNASFLEFGLP